jgi:TorA maturation chaperone TorD
MNLNSGSMKDSGLIEAIGAAGGESELARGIGISPPSMSSWDRIPVERLVAAETATGLDRAVLRPELFAGRTHMSDQPDEIGAARAQQYALLGILLARAPDADLLGRLAQLRVEATPLGLAQGALAQAAGEISLERVEREYFDLFIGLGRGELLPYASYYLTGFLHERPLARLREELARLGIERAEGNCEPEDHAAILCEIMAGLACGRFAAQPGTDHLLFEKHIAPWMGRFFADLEHAKAADFYRHVGALGRVFVQIESEAFELTT